KQQADLVEAERARAEDLARMAALREEQARRGEREAMAGEIHDALSGNLAAITIHAEACLANPAVAPQALQVVRTTSKQAMGEL
ncbi:two-component sensor histidine kinase, partial [Xanthomonas citri pv. citri]|nr:two-component sensor histidine kinase [Xanthomonas citri pv. citri]